MALVTSPKSPLVAQLRGFHLFHFDGAPCAQRVRFALGEKELVRGKEVPWESIDPATLDAARGTWTSRHVSLIKKQHLSDAYAAIQPNMVVPALVHDGKLYIESLDIIRYVDALWPASTLFPSFPTASALNEELLREGDALHVSVRYVSFRWGLGKLGKLNQKHEQTLARLEDPSSPEAMASFYQRFDRNGISDAIYCSHLAALTRGYAKLEHILRRDGEAFLCGDSLSAADILWSLKVLRIHECGYPFAEMFPTLYTWFERVRGRPAFKQGVMGKHRMMSSAFRIKAALEHLFGRGIRQTECWRSEEFRQIDSM